MEDAGFQPEARVIFLSIPISIYKVWRQLGRKWNERLPRLEVTRGWRMIITSHGNNNTYMAKVSIFSGGTGVNVKKKNSVSLIGS